MAMKKAYQWITLVCLLATLSPPVFSQSEGRVGDKRIWINQLGYRPSDAKTARFTGPETAFRLVDAGTGQPVLSGLSTAPVLEPNSGELLGALDFSSWRQPGKYFLDVPGVGRSSDFTLGEQVYQELLTASLKMLTYQRCGVETGTDLEADFYHAACHLDEAEIWGTNKTLRADGGWHDAGDYGKYVVPGAITVGHLLLTWELWPQAVPGILEEARFELDWLLRMQDPANGGVYHKLTGRNFPGMDVSPDYDLTTLVVSPISFTATADFGAVMAMAARVWKTADPAFAKTCLAAARKAFAWTKAHPFVPFTSPAGIQTGEYGDGEGQDEALWMAVELLRATGETAFATEVKKEAGNSSFRADSFGWADTGMFSVAGLLFAEKALVDQDTRLKAQRLLNARVADLQDTARDSPSGTMMRTGDFHWGSNMTVLDQAMILMLAHELDATVDISASLENLHYLLGSNALGISYVTGFGSNSVKNPHHRPSLAAGVFRPIPGMVSGGPNSDLQDPIAQSSLAGLPPAKAFLDDSASYSTNEVAIYWNSPLVFVLAALSQP